MSPKMTTKELLALSDDELALELAKVLVPWKHKDSRYDPVLQHGFYCTKCHKDLSNGVIQTHCPVPDPIKLDWNTAIEWFRKTGGAERELYHIYQRYVTCISGSQNETTFAGWLLNIAQPKHLLISAARKMKENAQNNKKTNCRTT